jgi:hypothetical protein
MNSLSDDEIAALIAALADKLSTHIKGERRALSEMRRITTRIEQLMLELDERVERRPKPASFDRCQMAAQQAWIA